MIELIIDNKSDESIELIEKPQVLYSYNKKKWLPFTLRFLSSLTIEDEIKLIKATELKIKSNDELILIKLVPHKVNKQKENYGILPIYAKYLSQSISW